MPLIANESYKARLDLSDTTTKKMSKCFQKEYFSNFLMIVRRGIDMGSGSVCFDFRSTNVVQLSMLSKSTNNYRQQPVTEP